MILASWHFKLLQTYFPVLQLSIWETNRRCPNSLSLKSLCELTKPLVSISGWDSVFQLCCWQRDRVRSLQLVLKCAVLFSLGRGIGLDCHDKEHLVFELPHGNIIKYLSVKFYVA